MSCKLVTRGLLLSAALLPMSMASATDLNVPLPYTTIQAAINAAASGDTVQIQPGTYNENITIGGKNITIKAFNTSFPPVIDGQQKGPVVTFSGAESNKCSLRNLTLQNGKGANGGGIKGNGTLATLKNVTIGANDATGSGGGIHGFSGLIQNCTITLNEAVNGGGIAECDGVIENSIITINKASATGGGFYNCEAVVQFCEITKNEAATRGGGVHQDKGIHIGNLISGNTVTATGPTNSPAAFGGGLNDMQGTVSLCLIAENGSAGDGGGVANSTGVFHNNIIQENGARRGAGMSNCTGKVENNTIYGNVASHNGGGCHNMGNEVTNTLIFGNSAAANQQWEGANVPHYSFVQNWIGSEPDIITGDPMVVDAARGRFQLLPQSPCIDAGKFVPHVTVDNEGDARPHDGTPEPRGDGSNFDIGADEYVPDNLDLASTFLDVTTKYKGKPGKMKGQIKGKFLVVANGTDSAEVPFGVQLFLSDDNMLDPTDQPVGKFVTVKKLKSGKSKKVKVSVKLPLNTTATGKFVLGWADTSNTIAEGDEYNNLAVAGPLP